MDYLEESYEEHYEVLQGSVLGPMLFSLTLLMTPRYTSDIHKHEPSHISNCIQDFKDYVFGNYVKKNC